MGLFGGLFGALGGVARIAGPILSFNPVTAPLGLELSAAGAFLPGNVENGLMDGDMQGYMASQSALFEQQLGFQNALSWRSSIFDEIMDQRTESMREQNTIRDIEVEQRKADNQITKKFIASITE